MLQVPDAGVGTVPAFLAKLWTLVEDHDFDHLIRWDETGRSFHVIDQANFAKDVLPLYFKHNNIASFIRQLNMYGFRKVMNVDHGGLRSEKDDLEFQHAYFLQGQEILLEHIKRKMPSLKSIDSGLKLHPNDVSKVLTDVSTLRGKQDTMNTKLDTMKRENEALWREVANLRQKHAKQQQIVNKLIHFLVTLVGGNQRPGLKRKMPLMLNDSCQIAVKSAKLSKQFSFDETRDNYTVESPDPLSSASPVVSAASSGPFIHEVTDVIDINELSRLDLPLPIRPAPSSLETNYDKLPPAVASHPTVQERASPAAMPTSSQLLKPEQKPPFIGDCDNSSTSSSLRFNNPSAGLEDNLSRSSSFSWGHMGLEMSDHLEMTQTDINSLKDILASPTYSFDPNFLTGLFDPGSPLVNDISDIEAETKSSSSGLPSYCDSTCGNEMVQYIPPDEMPSLLDLAEDSSDLLTSDLHMGTLYPDLDVPLDTPLPAIDDRFSLLSGPGVSADDLD